MYMYGSIEELALTLSLGVQRVIKPSSLLPSIRTAGRYVLLQQNTFWSLETSQVVQMLLNIITS